jgi:hypothetical protein
MGNDFHYSPESPIIHLQAVSASPGYDVYLTEASLNDITPDIPDLQVHTCVFHHNGLTGVIDGLPVAVEALNCEGRVSGDLKVAAVILEKHADKRHSNEIGHGFFLDTGHGGTTPEQDDQEDANGAPDQ